MTDIKTICIFWTAIKLLIDLTVVVIWGISR